jgi:hypothetical protein
MSFTLLAESMPSIDQFSLLPRCRIPLSLPLPEYHSPSTNYRAVSTGDSTADDNRYAEKPTVHAGFTSIGLELDTDIGLNLESDIRGTIQDIFCSWVRKYST